MLIESIRVLAPAFLASVAAASGDTWIVDVDGGPGVDFVELQVAIDSPLVADGDTLLVYPGTYDKLQLDRPLTIVGQGSDPSEVFLFRGSAPGSPSILDVDGPVTVANVEISGHLYVRDCSGPVVLAYVTAGKLEVSRTDQARLEQLTLSVGGPSLLAGDAAIEVNECDFSRSVSASSGTYLRMARTPAKGAHGEDADQWWSATDGGAGVTSRGANVQLLGDGQLIEGGTGGWGTSCGNDGKGGPAIHLDDPIIGPLPFVRHSGYLLEGGFIPAVWCDPDNAQAPPIKVEVGTVVEAVTPDPVLRIEGAPRPGETVQLSVRAQGTTSIFLFGGFSLTSTDLPGVVGRLGVLPEIMLGTSAGAKNLIVPLSIPPGVELGTVFAAQAFSLHPVGEAQRLSNSVTLVVH